MWASGCSLSGSITVGQEIPKLQVQLYVFSVYWQISRVTINLTLYWAKSKWKKSGPFIGCAHLFSVLIGWCTCALTNQNQKYLDGMSLPTPFMFLALGLWINTDLNGTVRRSDLERQIQVTFTNWSKTIRIICKLFLSWNVIILRKEWKTHLNVTFNWWQICYDYVMWSPEPEHQIICTGGQ